MFYSDFVYRMCVLGKRLLKDIDISNCTKEEGGPLYNLYCTYNATTTDCDPYFKENEVTIANGIMGLASGVFFGKWKNLYGFNFNHKIKQFRNIFLEIVVFCNLELFPGWFLISLTFKIGGLSSLKNKFNKNEFQIICFNFNFYNLQLEYL